MLNLLFLLVSLPAVEATLLVSKEPDCVQMSIGVDCAVHYYFYNAGNDTIYNIRMDDDWGLKMRGMATIVKGSTSARFAQLHPGELSFHAYVFQPNSVENGEKLYQLTSQSVAVRYELLNGEERLTHSSSIANTPRDGPHRRHILTNRAYKHVIDSKQQYWLVFGVLVSAPCLLSLYFHYQMDKQYPMTKSSSE